MLPGQGRARLLSHASSPGSRDPGWDSALVPSSTEHPALPQHKADGDGEPKVPPSISPTIPRWATPLLPAVLTAPEPAALGLTHSPVGVPPTPRAPVPPEPPATHQEREGDGWEAAGWQAGAAGQGKHSTGCSTGDLEIRLSYKEKKVQAGQALPAGLAQPNPAAAELRGTLRPLTNLSEQRKGTASPLLVPAEGDARYTAQRG